MTQTRIEKIKMEKNGNNGDITKDVVTGKKEIEEKKRYKFVLALKCPYCSKFLGTHPADSKDFLDRKWFKCDGCRGTFSTRKEDITVLEEYDENDNKEKEENKTNSINKNNEKQEKES